ncbi:MAG: formylglycine-generating enzyme family protein [Nitrospirae bacterium]|nr:formylglycine-generating enzyme family protein [Nitrospirota bacterium]
MFLVILTIVSLLAGCSHQNFIVKKDLPADMVYIPAGSFEMGSSESDGKLGMAIGVDELPRHMVYVDDFYMDRYEVTNAQFLDFVLKVNDPYRPSHWVEREVFKKGEDNYPVVDVDWLDADSYCKWAGKRLPTEVEWEKAARGTDGRLWPWGNEYDTGKANTAESGRKWTAAVGSYPGDVSPYGVYDMAGNVREWTSEWYTPYPGNTVSAGHYTGPYRVLRGGSYETPLYRYTRTASRYAIRSTLATRGHNWHSDFDHGFRCAKSP